MFVLTVSLQFAVLVAPSTRLYVYVRLRRFSEGKTATTPDPPAYDVKDATRGEYGLGDAALAPEWPRPDNPASPIRVERREQGECVGMGIALLVVLPTSGPSERVRHRACAIVVTSHNVLFTCREYPCSIF